MHEAGGSLVTDQQFCFEFREQHEAFNGRPSRGREEPLLAPRVFMQASVQHADPPTPLVSSHSRVASLSDLAAGRNAYHCSSSVRIIVLFVHARQFRRRMIVIGGGNGLPQIEEVNEVLRENEIERPIESNADLLL